MAVVESRLNAQEKDASTILRIVPYEEGFHFTTEKGVYIGLTANSLEDFATKLKSIDINSITYHYYRGDFQRWIQSTLGDKDFANELCFIDRQLSDDQLREELLKKVNKRSRELKGLNWIETEGI